jgi:hypothetical protein
MASLAFASPGLAADRVEPLTQYIVTGTDAELGSLGYDVTEGADATDPLRTGSSSRRSPSRSRRPRPYLNPT